LLGAKFWTFSVADSTICWDKKWANFHSFFSKKSLKIASFLYMDDGSSR
jgi:predicted enzyme involved in methoxymalonyl-ACP biosynthesis